MASTDTAPSLSPSLARASRVHTDGEWAALRDDFTFLYWTLDLPLVQVKQLLGTRTHAGLTTLKRQAERWGLFKQRRREDEMRYIVARFKTLGIHATYCVRDELVTTDEALTYFSRNKHKPKDSWTDSDFADLATPEDVQQLTPSPSDSGTGTSAAGKWEHDAGGSGGSADGSVSQADATHEEQNIDMSSSPVAATDASSDEQAVEEVEPSPHEHVALYVPVPESAYENASRNFRDSISCHYPYQLFTSDMGRVDYDIDALYPSVQFGGLFFQYLGQHRLRLYNEARATLHAACSKADELLLVQDPRLFLYLLEALACCRAYGYGHVAQQVNIHFAQRAWTLLGPQHPITVFCRALLHPGDDGRSDFVARGLLNMYTTVDNFARTDGRDVFRLETTKVLLTGSMVLKHQKSLDMASSFLGVLRPMYAQMYGQVSWQMVQVNVDDAHIAIAMGPQGFEAAAEKLDAASHTAALLVGPIDLDKTEAEMRCLVGTAALRAAQGRPAEQRAALQAAWVRGVEACLSEEHWMMRDIGARLSEVVL